MKETAGDCHVRGLPLRDGLRSVHEVGTDRNTDGALPLVDSTSHTPKLSVALKGIYFTLIYFCFLSRLTCLYLFACI